MKTDDDAFVRLDEILASLNRINISRVNFDSHPRQNPDSNYYISPEERPDDSILLKAAKEGHRKGITKPVSTRDIEKGQLKMFKPEDVAMGIWIADMKKQGLEVKGWMKRIFNEGCRDGYVIAHYQGPFENVVSLAEASGGKTC